MLSGMNAWAVIAFNQINLYTIRSMGPVFCCSYQAAENPQYQSKVSVHLSELYLPLSIRE